MSKNPLFAIPGNLPNIEMVRQIANKANVEYNEKQDGRQPAAALPSLEELREMAQSLAPYARESLKDCQVVERLNGRYNQWTGDPADIVVVEVMPIFAHFTLVMLAIIEAEGGVE